ncbi:MAG: hypothetical protein HRT58_10245 [Crocinitomicaceae bacterium]|nr:hypothetical protein [Flavobacteriales bacterium]NQZ36035.1 hypothetical protein [Crocinitomicaceae bacterium]
MKIFVLFISLCCLTLVNAQVINKQFNYQAPNANNEYGIVASQYNVGIVVQTVYRAKPDGYHIMFTTSFIGKDVEDVEARMNKKIDNLIKAVEHLKITSRDVVAEVTALDPIFESAIYTTTSTDPIGYKITENITFHTTDFADIRSLAKICMDFKIYDIVHVSPYIMSTTNIYDSLAEKSVEILNFKKDLSQKIGRKMIDGHPEFTKSKSVLYPSDSYLRSQIRNSRLYTHNITQNSDIDIQRNVQVDTYQNLNLRNADFIFHADVTVPVIEFYYRINYNYIIPPEEEEEEEPLPGEQKIFYHLDKDGNLQKIEFGKD